MCTGCWTLFQNTFLLGAACAALTVYIAVLVVLIKYYKTIFKRPFFTFCISLGFVEVTGLLRSIIDPAIYEYMKQHRDDTLFQRLYGGLGRLPWYGTLYHQIYIALERMTALLYPKVYDVMWTKRAMVVHYLTIASMTLASNLCVCTETCQYVLYPDGATNFYNMSVRGGVLHNRIVDLGIQPSVIVIVTLLYVVTGVKVVKMRRQIRSNVGKKNDNRKRRTEIMLVLQGFLVSAPQAITMIIYHIVIYVQMPDPLLVVMNLVQAVFKKVVYSASPFLYLFLNADIRMKLATLLVGKRGTVTSTVAAPITMGTAAAAPRATQIELALRRRVA